MTPKKKLPLRRALIWIIASTLLISGTTGLGILYYFHIQELQLTDERFTIRAIEDQGAKIGAEYLAEILGLSTDKTTNFYGFNYDEAKEKLMGCPVIDTASIKKIKPGTISINYTLRNPSFKILDVANTAIDRQGMLFPVEPFFQEIAAPEIYLGCIRETIAWGKELKHPSLEIAFDLLEQSRDLFLPLGLNIKKIDVSRTESSSYGGREIILVLDDPNIAQSNEEVWILRLHVKDRNQQLANFLALRSYLLKNRDFDFPFVADMRIPGLAYIGGVME